MKNLIINKIISELKGLKGLDNLSRLLNEWIGFDDFEYIAHGHDGYGTVRVIVADVCRLDNKYSLYRFFNIGDKWHVSVDDQDVEPNVIFISLLKNID